MLHHLYMYTTLCELFLSIIAKTVIKLPITLLYLRSTYFTSLYRHPFTRVAPFRRIPSRFLAFHWFPLKDTFWLPAQGHFPLKDSLRTNPYGFNTWKIWMFSKLWHLLMYSLKKSKNKKGSKQKFFNEGFFVSDFFTLLTSFLWGVWVLIMCSHVTTGY